MHPDIARATSAPRRRRRQPPGAPPYDATTMSSPGSAFEQMSDVDVDVERDDSRSDADDDHFSRSRYPRNLSPKTKEELRLRVNARERERMHDINGAMDALRQVMPYGNGPSVKKLSKMSTLLLARNYILTLTKNLDELRFCVTKVCMEQNKPIPNVARLGPAAAAAGLLPAAVDVAAPVSGLAYPGFPSASDRAYMYRTPVPCRSPARQDPPRRPPPPADRHYDDYPERTPDMTSSAGVRSGLKMKCNSRAGRPCFCVECLTKK